MKAGTQARVLTKVLTVKRAGTTVATAMASPLYPASPQVQQSYNIQSPRLGFTLWAAAGLASSVQVGDQLVHDDAPSAALYVVGLATWDDALELTAEMVK